MMRHFTPKDRRVIYIGRSGVGYLPHWIASDLCPPIEEKKHPVDAFSKRMYVTRYYRDNSLQNHGKGEKMKCPIDSLRSYVLQKDGKVAKWILICGRPHKRYAREKFMKMRDVY